VPEAGSITRTWSCWFCPVHTWAINCVEARVKLNDAGSSNGSFSLWIDGRFDARKENLNWVGRYDAYGINAVFFENDGAPKPMARYLDNFVVSTQRIRCS
jgi:hypothetical protein